MRCQVKQPLERTTLTHLSGKDVAGLLAYLWFGEKVDSALPIGVPVPWPAMTTTANRLAENRNGAAFSAEEYPELAKAYLTKNCLIYAVNLFMAGMTEVDIQATSHLKAMHRILKSLQNGKPVKGRGHKRMAKLGIRGFWGISG